MAGKRERKILHKRGRRNSTKRQRKFRKTRTQNATSARHNGMSFSTILGAPLGPARPEHREE